MGGGGRTEPAKQKTLDTSLNTHIIQSQSHFGERNKRVEQFLLALLTKSSEPPHHRLVHQETHRCKLKHLQNKITFMDEKKEGIYLV